MGGLIEALLNCLNFCMKYFLKVIHCRPVTTRPRRYCVQWVWSTEKYMLVQMIIYCIEKNSKDYIRVPDAGYQDKK